jgi:hypothetical protein
MEIRPIQRSDHYLGDPRLHRNVAWYATQDDRVFGVVLLDLVDLDYSWVVLTENEQGRPGFTAVDLGHSLTSEEIATKALHAAMTTTATKLGERNV